MELDVTQVHLLYVLCSLLQEVSTFWQTFGLLRTSRPSNYRTLTSGCHFSVYPLIQSPDQGRDDIGVRFALFPPFSRPRSSWPDTCPSSAVPVRIHHHTVRRNPLYLETQILLRHTPVRFQPLCCMDRDCFAVVHRFWGSYDCRCEFTLVFIRGG